jgi:hypothetical protein
LILETGVENADGSLILPRSWTRNTGGEQPPRIRQQIKKTTKKGSKHYRPEAARIQEVRILRGTSGSYSNDKDEQPISFEHRPF